LADQFDPALVIGALAAIGTFVLAVVTWYQAYESGKTVREMKATREAEYRPQLRASLSIRHRVVVFLKIINIGRAASVDIHLDVVLSKDKQIVEQRHFKPDAILPLEYAELILPNCQFDALPNVVTHIAITGTYKDGFGQTIPMNQLIDVKGYLDSIKQAQIVAEE
jgi:hypothetical protein